MSDRQPFQFPLSPLQQGMLSQALRSPDAGLNIEQVIASLNEELHITALQDAWRQGIARHDTLRASFSWKEYPEPIQRVHPSVEISLEQRDWRALSPADQGQKLDEFLEADRRRGFELDSAPMMRLALFQLAETEFKLVWTFHHAVLDGRSLVIVLREVFAIYDALVSGKKCEIPPAPSYRDFIDWLGTRDRSDSENYWRTALKGVRPVTAIDLPKGNNRDPAQQEQSITLPREAAMALESLARDQGCTLEVLVQAAWALVLARYAREEEVLFGAVLPCRNPALPGVGEIAGLLINTLPVRAAVTPDVPLSELLKSLHAQHTSMQEHAQTPLMDIQRWTGVAPLFDSIVLFENQTLDAALPASAHRHFELRERTGYPLALYCTSQPELSLKIVADGAWQRADIARMAGHLATMLDAFQAMPANRPARCPC